MLVVVVVLADADAAFHLAAGDAAGDQLAHLRLDHAQLFRQPHLHVEVAVVHRAQFNG
ncbi:hypothetical protein D3C78_1782330 [compost metagenome]